MIRVGYLLLIVLFGMRLVVKAQTKEDAVTTRIDQFVQQQKEDAAIPGLSVTVIKGAQLFFKREYGYANIKERQPVSSNTLFEIGSNSKAFTALGILYLEKKGLLSLNDPVRKYLPWLKLPFIDENNKVLYPEIHLRDLFYHTSGIPFNTIGLFKSGTGDQDLEETIKRLSGTRLDFYPGERYLYATINYDILGLIIQKVTGETYEGFITAHVLKPLGLTNTVLFRSDAKNNIASGYKYNFLWLQQYNAPVYRANTPAGYILSNSIDMERWVRFQLSLIKDSIYTPLIERSHSPDYISKGNADNTFYGGGWLVYKANKKLIMHNGNNPNYSSSIVLDSSKHLGIVILANINSTYTKHIAEGIYDILSDRKIRKAEKDLYKGVNSLSGLLLLLAGIFSFVTLVFLAFLIQELISHKRTLYIYNNRINGVKFTGALLFIGGFAYCLYLMPATIYNGLSWDFFKVWAPGSLMVSMKVLYASFLLFFVYFLLNSIFPKADDNSFYCLVVLALLSGIGNATIIYSINASVNDRSASALSLLPYFIFGLFTYLYTRRLLSEKIITLTNTRLYLLKKELINKILNVSFHKFEKIPREHLFVVLNNDANEVSQFPAVVVQMATGIVTLVCCFIYLGMVNIWGLCLSGIAILVVCTLYYSVSQSANKIMRESIDIQIILSNVIDNIWRGFKELKLNFLKKLQIEEDFDKSNVQHRRKNISAQVQFANAFVIGELSFSFIFCVVIFIFPFIFADLQKDELRSFVFIFLYMNGPVNIILNAFPSLTRIRVSWSRISQFRQHFTQEEEDIDAEEWVAKHFNNNGIRGLLCFEDIEYSYYDNRSKEGFKIGPVSCSFGSGEIVFITGGNGSGKSTLAKVITGLYSPDSGTITLNDEPIDRCTLAQKFTAIFSDYHLFNKLYGIDHIQKAALLKDKLRKLRLEDKLEIKDGVFNTLSLSTGQRKRMALLVSYLEDKPFCLFDEWASDQDIEFRDFFYTTLLPELKMQGKAVIVISHDDRYFNIADRIYDMRMGKMVNRNTEPEIINNSNTGFQV